MAVAVFVDILGVASAIDRSPDDYMPVISVPSVGSDQAEILSRFLEALQPHLNPSASEHTELAAGEDEPEFEKWRTAIGIFPYVVDLALVQTRNALGFIDLIYYALFSDSAFLVFDGARFVVPFCKALLTNALEQKVPLRGGVGAGNFYFSNSRFSFTQGVGPRVESSFLGSAIVRAYRAESCGLKGIRIFLHKGVDPLLPVEARVHVTAIGPDETERFQSRSRGRELCVSGEISIGAEWELASELDAALQHVNEIEQVFGATERDAAVHYEETRQALVKMWEVDRERKAEAVQGKLMAAFERGQQLMREEVERSRQEKQK